CTFTNRFTNLDQDFHIGPADPTLLDRFEANDKRKLLTYTFRLFNTDEANKEYRWEWPVTTPIYGKWIHRSGYVTTGASPTIERAGASTAAQPNNINRIEIRYAEVLLIKAEALFFLGRASTGLSYVNQLRERAGVAPLTTLTEDALFREWELELTFEQKRWTNLTRWKTYIKTIQTVENFEYYKETYNTPESITAVFGTEIDGKTVNAAFYAKVYKHLHAKHDNVKGKFYRFPIPKLSGIDLGITQQNPGY
ncbi:MAG: RagB/SusD family nutrient uptake outer membrane protein, partial [Prevotellaceae bacterium]|nr:RagB/SusD family nutrient uptake outer membrane protein [Prevotellaceae bacterium]